MDGVDQLCHFFGLSGIAGAPHAANDSQRCQDPLRGSAQDHAHCAEFCFVGSWFQQGPDGSFSQWRAFVGRLKANPAKANLGLYRRPFCAPDKQNHCVIELRLCKSRAAREFAAQALPCLALVPVSHGASKS